MTTDWQQHDDYASCYTAASSDNGRPEEVHERRYDGSCRCGHYTSR